MKPSRAVVVTNVEVNRFGSPNDLSGLKVDTPYRRRSVMTLTNPLLIFFLLAFAVPIAATTLVAIRTSTEVVLAADSLRVNYMTGEALSECKIFPCGRYFVGLGGIYSVRNGKTTFNAFELARDACQTPLKSGTETMDRIVGALKPGYTKILEEIARTKPQIYEDGIRSKELFINVVLVGFEGDQPFMLGRDLVPPTLPASPFSLRVDKQDFTRPLSASQGDSYFLGSHAGFDRFVSTRPYFWGLLGPVEGARFMVAYEIADEPDKVGPPIDILRVTKNGHEWIQQKPNCKEAKKDQPQTRRSGSRRKAF